MEDWSDFLTPITDSEGNIVEWVLGGSNWCCGATILIVGFLGVFILPFYAIYKGIKAWRKGHKLSALVMFAIPMFYITVLLGSAIISYAGDKLICKSVDIQADVENNRIYVKSNYGNTKAMLSINQGKPTGNFGIRINGEQYWYQLDEPLRDLQLVYVWKYGKTPLVSDMKSQMCNYMVVSNGELISESRETFIKKLFEFLGGKPDN